MVLTILFFYCYLMELKEILSYFVSELTERIGRFEQKDETLDEKQAFFTIVEMDDFEYTICVLQEVVESFAGEYEIQFTVEIGRDEITVGLHNIDIDLSELYNT